MRESPPHPHDLRRGGFYIQVGLKWFLIACALIGTVVGVIVRTWNQKIEFHGISGKSGRYHWAGQWLEQHGRKRLVAMVLIPPTTTPWAIVSSDVGDPQPPQEGLCFWREDLFLDGAKVDLSEARVFVLTSQGNLRPIVLDSDQLGTITPDSMGRMSQLPVFQQHILTVLIEEESQGKKGNFKLPLQLRRQAKRRNEKEERQGVGNRLLT